VKPVISAPVAESLVKKILVQMQRYLSCSFSLPWALTLLFKGAERDIRQYVDSISDESGTVNTAVNQVSQTVLVEASSTPSLIRS